MTIVVSEELSILRFCSIGMDLKGIEVVRKYW